MRLFWLSLKLLSPALRGGRGREKGAEGGRGGQKGGEGWGGGREKDEEMCGCGWEGCLCMYLYVCNDLEIIDK